MQLYFSGDLQHLEEGISILAREYDFEISSNGIPVFVQRQEGCLEVQYDHQGGLIVFEKTNHFFRGLGLLLEAFRDHKTQFRICEQPQFELNGPMVDVSRNAVLKVESIKLLLRKMAIMGLNMLMLYTEDTYTVEDTPFFGYMRGKYSHDELKDCDDYANYFDIQIIPCIQTLGHLMQALKWECAIELRDTEDILLVGSERSYELLDKMIRSMSSPFRSNRIHIGMDEAHNLGLGKYLEQNGYRRRFDIIMEHLQRVVEITSKYHLKPMMWSDMFFRLGSKTGDYYDPNAVIPDDVIQLVPQNLNLVFWDYYHHDENIYRDYFRKHKLFGNVPVFAGGIWTFNGICVNNRKTFASTNAALSACRKEGIKEVIATMWGDNGAETNIFAGLLGLQLFAEHGYTEQLDMDKLRSRFEFCTGGSFEGFMDLGSPDTTPGTGTGSIDDETNYNPSKYLLWQDILMGLFDKHVQGLPLAEYYRNTQLKLEQHKLAYPTWAWLFDVPEKLCRVLTLKCDMGVRIKNFYDQSDSDNLREIAEHELPQLSIFINELRAAHRDQWFKTNKAFGWEVLDIRYGGILARIDSIRIRLSDYLEGRIEKLEELEEERLFFHNPKESDEILLPSYNWYSRIATACPL